jgi:hypothetical protein
MEFIDQFPIDEIENSDSVANEIKPRKRSSLLFQHSRTSSSIGSDSAITLPLTLQSLCQHTEVRLNKNPSNQRVTTEIFGKSRKELKVRQPQLSVD